MINMRTPPSSLGFKTETRQRCRDNDVAGIGIQLLSRMGVNRDLAQKAKRYPTVIPLKEPGNYEAGEPSTFT